MRISQAQAPGGEGVEHPDDGDGDVGGERNRPLGILGLFPIDGRRLEPNEAAKGEHQGDTQAGTSDVGGAKSGPSEAAGISLQNDGDIEHQEYQHLKDHQNAEDLGGYIDVQVTEHADNGDHENHHQTPIQLDVGK
ncbi:hypothetical protein D9M68_574040 [compost metagenome]